MLLVRIPAITQVIFSENGIDPTLSLVSLADLGEGCRAQRRPDSSGRFLFRLRSNPLSASLPPPATSGRSQHLSIQCYDSAVRRRGLRLAPHNFLEEPWQAPQSWK